MIIIHPASLVRIPWQSLLARSKNVVATWIEIVFTQSQFDDMYLGTKYWIGVE